MSGLLPRSIGRAAAVVGIALAAHVPTSVAAHPADGSDIDQHIAVEIGPSAVRVDYVAVMAEIVALGEFRTADTDADGTTTAGEWSAHAGRVCPAPGEDLAVRLDGAAIPLTLREAATVPSPGRSGLTTLRLSCVYEGALAAPPTDGTVVSIENDAFAGWPGWREMVLRSQVVGIETSLPAVSPSAVLTDVDRDRPIVHYRGTGTIDASAKPRSEIAAAPDDGGPGTGVLAAYLDGTDTGALALLAALAAAVGLGAVHALAPGHGKTLMAAYLVAGRGTRSQAAVLGLVVAASHTVGVAALGGVAWAAATRFRPDRIYPVVSIVSGLVVLAVGLALVARLRRDEGAPAGPHRHDPPSTGGLVALGLSGGLVPSASAVLLLLGAISLGRVGLGLALVALFGLGMAAVLVGVGLVVVTARDAGVRRLGGRFGRFVREVAPALGAVAVTLIGLALTARAVIAL